MKKCRINLKRERFKIELFNRVKKCYHLNAMSPGLNPKMIPKHGDIVKRNGEGSLWYKNFTWTERWLEEVNDE